MLVSNKKYDLVIYGATGFTGRLICEYLSTHKDTAGLNWAIAGRDTAKLESISNQFSSIPINFHQFPSISINFPLIFHQFQSISINFPSIPTF